MGCGLKVAHFLKLDNLHGLYENIRKLKSMVGQLEGSNDSLTSHLNCLEASLDAEVKRREELECTVVALKSATDVLTVEVDTLRKQVGKLSEDSAVVYAKSIVRAAESRFVKLLCEGMSHDKREDFNFKTMKEINDVSVHELPDSVRMQQNIHGKAWCHRIMARVIRNLTKASAPCCHREDREQVHFETLSEDNVLQALNRLPAHQRFNDKEKQTVLMLHKASMKTTEDVEITTRTDDGA